MATTTVDVKSGYMRGPVFDAWMIFGCLGLALIVASVFTFFPYYTELAAIIMFWVTSNTHATVTYIKAMWDKSSRRKYIHFVTWVPGFLFLVSAAIWTWVGAAALVSIYFYVQLFHYARQSYGISGIYRRAAHRPLGDVFHQFVLYSVVVWGICYRMQEGFTFFSYDIYAYAFGEGMVLVLQFLMVALYGVWILIQLSDYLKGQFSASYFFYMISHFIIFYLALVGFKDAMQGWFVSAYWHGMQYVLFVWHHFNRSLHHEKIGEWPLFKFISRNFFLFAASAFLYSLIFVKVLKFTFSSVTFWALPVFFIITLMFNFNHYIMDALIWRRPKKAEEMPL